MKKHTHKDTTQSPLAFPITQQDGDSDEHKCGELPSI